ncbi:MAG TPA: BatD family protein [Polyangiaceae bacterium]|nr:BatD family protein [Polyangiaceae bacterium]
MKRAADQAARAARLCAIFAGALVVLASSRAAGAQSPPQIDVQTDEPVAAVGDRVHVQATASSPEAMPGNPQLGPTPGFVVRGQTASPSQVVTFNNGSLTHGYTLTVDWVLEAQRVGTFQIGPPSFALGATRYSGRSVSLRVAPPGSAPRRRAPARPQSPFSFSPFDPWRNLFPDLSPPEPPPQAPVTIDPKLSLDAPRASDVFVHATVDKTSAVVGEEVLYNVYQYTETSLVGQTQSGDDHVPQVADFVKQSLLPDGPDRPTVGFASIGGKTWQVVALQRWALFPLRAGDLEITPLTENIAFALQRGMVARSSETLHVRVSDPPLSGRPPGYAQGQVGHFVLKAEVNPRSLQQGGAIEVRVELSGTGNLPTRLSPPAMEGVEWMAPEVHDSLGPNGQGHYGGQRTFDFLVHVNRAGSVDLGELTLPYFDPDPKRYEVARAALGVVRVAPSDAPKADAPASAERLPGLPPPRDALVNRPRTQKHLADSPVFWLGAVAGWPMALGVAVGGDAVLRRIARAWRRRRTSPAAELRDRIALARTAYDGSDARQVDAAIVRVLEAAAVANAGINVRGALGDEVVRRLEGAGVAHDAAASVAALLRECEQARFAPEAADLAAARDRWGRAERTIRMLERRG